MKTFLVLVLTLTALFLWQRNAGRSGASASQGAPTTVSEHNWPKNSIDRAQEIVDRVQTMREQERQEQR